MSRKVDKSTISNFINNILSCKENRDVQNKSLTGQDKFPIGENYLSHSNVQDFERNEESEISSASGMLSRKSTADNTKNVTVDFSEIEKNKTDVDIIQHISKVTEISYSPTGSPISARNECITNETHVFAVPSIPPPKAKQSYPNIRALANSDELRPAQKDLILSGMFYRVAILIKKELLRGNTNEKAEKWVSDCINSKLLAPEFFTEPLFDSSNTYYVPNRSILPREQEPCEDGIGLYSVQPMKVNYSGLSGRSNSFISGGAYPTRKISTHFENISVPLRTNYDFEIKDPVPISSEEKTQSRKTNESLLIRPKTISQSNCAAAQSDPTKCNQEIHKDCVVVINKANLRGIKRKRSLERGHKIMAVPVKLREAKLSPSGSERMKRNSNVPKDDLERSRCGRLIKKPQPFWLNSN